MATYTPLNATKQNFNNLIPEKWPTRSSDCHFMMFPGADKSPTSRINKLVKHSKSLIKIKLVDIYIKEEKSKKRQ
jgi:hypothetical protein